MSEERTKMRDSMADSCVLSMRCSLWDADETRQNTEAIRAALDRYADAVAACENKEVKRAWLAAWDAEYRLQHYARTWHAASEKWAEWAGEEEQLLAANKTAWLAAWDAEYRAQVTRAPLVEALRVELDDARERARGSTHWPGCSANHRECATYERVEAALAAYEAGRR